MKSVFLILIILGLISFKAFTQKEIHLKSEPKAFNLVKEDKTPKLPPILSVNLTVSEPSGDKMIEGGENAVLKLTILNRGKGEAQALKLKITDEVSDSSFSFEGTKIIDKILPESSVDVDVPITTDFNLKSKKHILHINLEEGNGYDLVPPAQLVLNTLEYRKPKLSYLGYEICDTCEGASPIIADNKVQPGELVKIRMSVQNSGPNIARGVNYLVLSKDQNVKLTKNSGNLGDLSVGEDKSFMINASPTKQFMNAELPLSLSLSLYKNIGNLENIPVTVPVNQKSAEAIVVGAIPDSKKIEQPNPANVNAAPDKSSFKSIELAPVSKTRRYNAVALVIGIENYSYLPKAIYAENDAKIITSYFKNTLGISNVIFDSDKANYAYFDDMFNLEYGALKSAVVQDKTDVFIFFSGHGFPSTVGEQIYLMPSDSKKEALSNRGFNVLVFYENLQHIGARNVIVFMDAGFSGISRQSETIQPENMLEMNAVKADMKHKDPWINNPAFSIFNSTSSNGRSFAYDQSSTGLYTYYLCLGLQGEADSNNDKKITTGELAQYIQKEIVQSSGRFGSLQTPQFHGNSNYVLVEY